MEQENSVPDDGMKESAALMNTPPQSFDGSLVQSPQVNFVEAMEIALPVLGLKLSETENFLDKVDQLFLQKGCSLIGKEQADSSNHASAMAKGKSKVDILQHAHKLKAENFLISLLRIGQWQRASRNECDLVGKCYFAKKKLVWEFLENGLKSKIEIQWSDILSLRAVLNEGQPGILELELAQPPLFFHEQDPQPRKHTQWTQVDDFTGEQALNYRRHYLESPPGALDRPLDKLLSYDRRLSKLSQQGFPTLSSPFFPKQTSESEHPSVDFGGQLQIIPQHHQQQQQLSFENVPTHYPTFELAPLNSSIPGTWTTETVIMSNYHCNQMPLLDGINLGDNPIPDQISDMMPVMPTNAATSISFLNNDLPPLPPTEFAELAPLQPPPVFRTSNDQHHNMLLNNLQTRFSKGMADANLFLRRQLRNNSNDVVSPNMVDNSVLMNNALPSNVAGGEQMNHIPPVMNLTSDNSSSSSSLNSDDPFNHEINIWTHDFSHQPWQ